MNTTEIDAIRLRDAAVGLNRDSQPERDRRTLLAALDEVRKDIQDEEAGHTATQQKLDIATTQSSTRKRRVEIGCELETGLRSELNASKSENKVLRTCFGIADDETVVSSVEGSVLIDSKIGSRRRYFVATDEERSLKEQLDAVTKAFAALRRCATCDRVGGFTCSHYSCEECVLDLTAERDLAIKQRDALLETEDS